METVDTSDDLDAPPEWDRDHACEALARRFEARCADEGWEVNHADLIARIGLHKARYFTQARYDQEYRNNSVRRRHTRKCMNRAAEYAVECASDDPTATEITEAHMAVAFEKMHGHFDDLANRLGRIRGSAPIKLTGLVC
jgi:hypothetical protein